MAEALAAIGLTASIVQLVEFGAKVVGRLKDFQHRAGDVPKTFQNITVELPLLIKALEQTKLQPTAGHGSQDLESTLENLVQDCYAQVELLDEILVKTLPGPSDSTLRRGRKAFDSLRQEGKVKQITKTLGNHVQLLTYYHISTPSQLQPTKAKAIFMIPFVRDDCFIDRAEIFDDIRQQFSAQKRVALAGIGGVGKSQIAIEFCYRFKHAYPDHNVFWAHAGTMAKFDQAYKDIARKLCLPGWDNPQADILQLVTDWLDDEGHGHWLLVIDNADDGEVFFGTGSSTSGQENTQTTQLFKYLPKSSKGSILVTTRDRRVGELMCDRKAAIGIPTLDLPKAEALLRSKVPKDKFTVEHAHDLLSDLGNLPLAITQAAAFISDNHTTLKHYLDILHDKKQETAELLSEGLKDPRRDLDAPSSVIQTWKVSFDQIRKQEPRAADLLSLMAVLDRQGIPKTVLSEEHERTIDLTSALGTLQAFSLITAETGGATFGMHRLVQLSTRRWLELQGDIRKWQQKASVQVSNVFPNGNYENWPVCEGLSPHAQIVLQYESRQESHSLQRASLLNNMASYERMRGQYKVAFGYGEEALEIRENQLGATHVDTLDSADELAHIIALQGNLKAAEQRYRQTLEHREKKLGLQDEDTLANMENLGIVLGEQGKYEAAEQMHRQILEARERTLGLQHLSTLVSMNNLGVVLTKQGRYEAAEQMLRRKLLANEERLGLQHPDTCLSLNNLAKVLQGQRKYEAAEQLYRQALQGEQKCLGLQHPATLSSLYNLAHTLQMQSRYEEAEPLYRQAMEGGEKTLGSLHPQTLKYVRGLAFIHAIQEDLDGAIDLMQRALVGHQEAFGDDDPLTKICAEALSRMIRAKAGKGKEDEGSSEDEEAREEDGIGEGEEGEEGEEDEEDKEGEETADESKAAPLPPLENLVLIPTKVSADGTSTTV